MTILGKYEVNKHEETSDCAGTEVLAVCTAVPGPVWFCGDETVELADAGSFWLAFDYVLASAWDLDS
jgi:hypothetical protein